MKKILLTLLIVYSVLLTAYVIYLQTPFNDNGHRVFGVQSQKSYQLADSIFRSLGGLSKDLTFKAGPTRQTVYTGGVVLNLMVPDSFVSGTGISFPVDNPRQAAESAAAICRSFGASTKIINLDPAVGDKLLLLSTDALPWQIVFRRPLVKMGAKPTAVSDK